MRLANRTRELNLFTQMLRQEVEHRILLIKAESGYGKTDLLDYFAHHCSSQYRTVQLDLRDATLGTTYLISRLQRKLGQGRFPQFEKSLREFLSGSIDITDTEIIGQENILQVVLNDTDQNQRNLRFDRLKASFFEDLAGFNQRTVLLLDTFNAASRELRDWIEGQFLSEMSQLDQFVVVVAGQITPEPSIEWRRFHHHYELHEIEQEAWQQYIRDSNRPLTPEHVEAILTFFKVPADVVKAFQAVERGQRL
jgi:hypothetical protein